LTFIQRAGEKPHKPQHFNFAHLTKCPAFLLLFTLCFLLAIYPVPAPARIASFGQVVRKAVGTGLVLECLAVGNPTPRARWLTRDRPVTFSPFYEVTNEGNLKIHRK